MSHGQLLVELFRILNKRRKMMKKVLCCFVFIILLLCLFLTGCSIFNTNTVTLDGISYKKASYKKDGDIIEGYSVVGCKPGVTKLNIVDKVKGLPVLSIEKYAFKDNKDLQEVIIPDSVDHIALQTAPFMGCEKIEKITTPFSNITLLFDNYGGATSVNKIPDSLKYIYLSDACSKISTNAFYNCENLREVHIPSSVTEIIDGTGFVSVGVNGHSPSSDKFSDLPFFGCKNVTIYCEVNSKPSGWGIYWNYIDSTHVAKVNWGKY